MTKRFTVRFAIVAVFLMLFNTTYALAIDIVRVNKGKSRSSIQTQYKMEILHSALRLTEATYGAYDIVTQGPATSIDRAILEVNSGQTINTFFAITTNKWEHYTTAIRIPIRRGILNYRLLFTTEEKLKHFENIKTLDQLKQLKIGLRSGWATTHLLKEQGFKVVEANTYDGLFYMLSSGRVDYIPRGINEIYTELARHQSELTNLVIEPTIALHIPAPFYIFVSPNEKRLAQRLTTGLEMMVNNQQLQQIFNRYYAKHVANAKLNTRQLFNINNPNLPTKTPLKRKELWFEYDN
ncbi:substrate-binding periplasmic protein [Thalassotalea sp. PLHSN55]|uniref:substrate-binding periplasmic protein n=1 Tax=Thalassotalea sp. PLHSN55 TaxID=3435888 RepID=UPI003F84AC2E